MKNKTHLSKLACAVALFGLTGFFTTANAATLASWDVFADGNATGGFEADATLTDFTATITGSTVSTSGYDSNDGTFGTVAGASTSTGVPNKSIRVNNSFDTAIFTLTNNTGTDYNINSLHFDYEVREAGTGFTLEYTSGGLGPASTTIATLTNIPFNSYVSGAFDFTDYDYTLASSLTDILLADGESAVFTFTTTSGSNSSKIFDNIAFQGTVVPEPSSFALFAGMFGLTWVMLRRRS